MPGLDHVSITVRDLARARAFYRAVMRPLGIADAAGLASGGRDAGAPGLRAHYHPQYYAAFLEDPEGNRIEAVFHHGETP